MGVACASRGDTPERKREREKFSPAEEMSAQFTLDDVDIIERREISFQALRLDCISALMLKQLDETGEEYPRKA